MSGEEVCAVTHRNLLLFVSPFLSREVGKQIGGNTLGKLNEGAFFASTQPCGTVTLTGFAENVDGTGGHHPYKNATRIIGM